MKVRDLMTADVKTCQPHASLNEAARTMWEVNCGSVPIVDDAQKVIGMLTDRDICMAAYTQGKTLSDIHASSAMAKPVVTCRPEDELAVAERAMQKAQVRRLPVVDADGRLVGVLTLHDLARQAARDRTSKTRVLGTDEVAVTLAAIGEPRRAEPAPPPLASSKTAAPAKARDAAS